MLRDTGSMVLKNGFGDLSEERSYIVGIPAIVYKGNNNLNFNSFLRRLLTRIREFPVSKLDPDHLLDSAYSIFSRSEDFSVADGVDGYLYPTKYRGYYSPDDGLYDILNSLKTVAKSKTLVHIGYRSARRGFSGEPILVTRPYIGRVDKVSEDGKTLKLKIGDEYRTFRIAELKWFAKFENQYADGVLRHVHLTFEPQSTGKTILTWRTLDGENSPLLTELWHQPLDYVEKQELKQKSEPSSSWDDEDEDELFALTMRDETPDTLSFSHERLKTHYGLFLRIEVVNGNAVVEEIHMRLIASRFDPSSGCLRLHGEGGIELYELAKNFKFYSLEED
jgi:hypothetical protein